MRNPSAARAEPAALAALTQSDQRAEALLQAADHLTDVLEAHGARRALAVVNLCGSQRMRTQRQAKEALLATLLPDAGRAQRLQALVAEFEAVQRRTRTRPCRRLRSAPHSRPHSRPHKRAGGCCCARRGPANTLALVQASESLLHRLTPRRKGR